LDYGTGSGILSIFAIKSGAKKCLAVDIDEETLDSATENVALNDLSNQINVIHTRSVYLGDNKFPLFDITIANILPGALTRLTAVLCLLTKPDGLLCLSGIRPVQLPAIKK
jgi:ribosomal protein L11 methyltransferase